MTHTARSDTPPESCFGLDMYGYSEALRLWEQYDVPLLEGRFEPTINAAWQTLQEIVEPGCHVRYRESGLFETSSDGYEYGILLATHPLDEESEHIECNMAWEIAWMRAPVQFSRELHPRAPILFLAEFDVADDLWLSGHSIIEYAWLAEKKKWPHLKPSRRKQV